MYWTKEDSENVLVYNSIEDATHKAAFFEDKLHDVIDTMISIELRQVNRDNDKDLAQSAMLKVLLNINKINSAVTAQFYLIRIVRSSVRLYLMRTNPANKYDTINECGFASVEGCKITVPATIRLEQVQELSSTRKRIISELTRKQSENKSLSPFVEAIKDYILLNDYEPAGCRQVVCDRLNIKESTFVEYCNRLNMKAKVFK
jgi:hypothetical protein